MNKKSKLVGYCSVALLALIGSRAFCSYSPEESNYSDYLRNITRDCVNEVLGKKLNYSPNKTSGGLPLQEFQFSFPIEQRPLYADTVLELGKSDPKNFEKYTGFCNQFDETNYGDYNYCEQSKLTEFQDGVKDIWEIKKLHCEVNKTKHSTRRTIKNLKNKIEKRHKEGRVKLSTGALRWFPGDDYSQKIQKALKISVKEARAAVSAKKGKNPKKNIEKTSKMKTRASRRKL